MNASITRSKETHNSADSSAVREGYRRTDVGVIPRDWLVKSLPDVCRFRGGKAHERFISDSGPFICVNSKFISTHGSVRKYSTANFCPAKLDDVLMVMSDLPNGRALAKAFLADQANVYAVNQRVCALTPYRDFPKYLFYALDRNPYFLKFDDGVNQTHLLNHVFQRCLLPLPPTQGEQRAIGEALSDVDGLLGTLEALIAKKQAIKQGATQQLITGKTRLPGFRGEWGTKRLGEIADVDPENLPNGTDPDYAFNYISLEQVDAGRLLGFSEEVFRTAPSRARRVLRCGDVLMSTVRPNLMAHLFFREQIEKAVCSTGFAVLRAKRGVSDPAFLFAHLFGHVVNNQIDRTLAGSNYPAINSRDVKLIEIPCPPEVHEQTAIATVLSDIDAEIAALERRRDKTRGIKQGMMQQLLTGRVRLVEPSQQKASI